MKKGLKVQFTYLYMDNIQIIYFFSLSQKIFCNHFITDRRSFQANEDEWPAHLLMSYFVSIIDQMCECEVNFAGILNASFVHHPKLKMFRLNC